jgi:hypothetical protein
VKSGVYGFGVVLLEMLSGLRAYCSSWLVALTFYKRSDALFHFLFVSSGMSTESFFFCFFQM